MSKEPNNINNIDDIIFNDTGDCVTKIDNFNIYAGADVDEDTGEPINAFMFSIEWINPNGENSALLDCKYGYKTKKQMVKELRDSLTRRVAQGWA